MRELARPCVIVLVAAVGVPVAWAGASPTQPLTATAFVPKNAAAAAAARIARKQAAVELVNRAVRTVRERYAPCRGAVRVPAARAINHAAAAGLVANIAALRRAQMPSDRPPGSAAVVPDAVSYADQTRELTTAGGQHLTLAIARSQFVVPAVPARCAAAERGELGALTAGRPRAVSAVAFRLLSSDLRAQRAAHAHRDPLGGEPYLFTRDAAGRAGGGGGDARSFAAHGLFFELGGPARAGSGSSLLVGLLPDAVASVTLEYPRIVSRGENYKPARFTHALRRVVRVQQNVISVSVSRPAPDAYPPRMVWRAADGNVLRVLSRR